jgi:hypothetical protein
MYNGCTGNFPFMSLDSNVCFFVMNHYKTNVIFAAPIPGLDSKNILDAYTRNFEYLVSKGYNPKINIMDNQATKQSNPTSPHNNVVFNLSSQATIGSTQLNVPSKHSKIVSLVPWAQRTLIFLSNCGTSLHHRCRTPSTSFNNHESTV